MFQDNLVYFRKREKLTQAELAKKLGISRSALSMYEKGLREPSFETLEIIADFFNINMSTLIGEKEALEKSLSPARQKLLDAVRDLNDEQIDKLLLIIEAAKGM